MDDGGIEAAALIQTARLEEDLARTLEQSESHRAQLETLIETLPEGFAFFDRDLRFVHVNDVLADMSNRRREDMLGQRLSDVFPSLDTEVAPYLEAVFETGEPGIGREVSTRALDGVGPRHFLVDYYPVRLMGEEITGIGALVRDITHRVRAERERQDLEIEVSELQKLETVAQLAGGVAHDFNNLLAIIQLRTELLRRKQPASEFELELDSIEEAVDQGRELAQKLLRFSRRGEHVAPICVNLDDIVRGLERLLGSTIGERITLRFDLGHVPDVLIEAGGLEQVVLNLVVNARDAMPEGGEITIITRLVHDRSSDDDGTVPMVRLDVSDTGTGMSDATRRRVFEPFFTTKPTGLGVGLGLSTVYGIVSAAGGTTIIQSAEGAGTTVRIDLPSAGPAEAIPPPADLVAFDGRNCRVLLVEDEPSVAEAVRDALIGVGFEVLCSSSGPEALEAAKAVGRIDLLVSDVSMPGMSGPELAQAIQRSGDGVPVLLMSGYADGEITRPGDDGYEHEILRKPFSLTALVERIRTLMADRLEPEPVDESRS
jgi:two-component system, cell cycle sensor histidine kinase and response regulator CckA